MIEKAIIAEDVEVGENGGAMENMSDEELEAEKKRLLAELEKAKKTQKETGQVRDETVKTAKKPRAKPRKRIVRKKEDIK